MNTRVGSLIIRGIMHTVILFLKFTYYLTILCKIGLFLRNLIFLKRKIMKIIAWFIFVKVLNSIIEYLFIELIILYFFLIIEI